MTNRKISQRRACDILRISRSFLRYVPKKKDQKLIECLKVMAGKYPRFGVRRLHAVARRNGWRVNIKKVRRLCRLQGLLIPKKRHRKRWKGSGRLPCKAEHVNHVWPYDFVHDSCENGQKIKFLTVIEEYTRYCLDPWINFVGVPQEKKTGELSYLDFIRPLEIASGDMEAFFFDEFNRDDDSNQKQFTSFDRHPLVN